MARNQVPLRPDLQERLRRRIRRDGAAATAKALGIASHTLARCAAGLDVNSTTRLAVTAALGAAS